LKVIGGGSNAMAWVTMEVNLGIIVACLPGIRPILGRIFPTWFIDFSKDNTPQSPSSPIEFQGKTSPDISVADANVNLNRGSEVFQVVVVDEEGSAGGGLEVRECEKNGKRRSFMGLLKEGKMIKMTLLKSKPGDSNQLPTAMTGESTQNIVRQDEESSSIERKYSK
jgi:hypothetical protein